MGHYVNSGKETLLFEPAPGPQIIYYSASGRMAGIILAGLLQSGFRAITTNSTYITILKAAQFVPRLVIIDISTSNPKGFAVIAALKKSIRTSRASILLLLPAAPADFFDTLKKTYWDPRSKKEMGEIPFLRYPFSFGDLVRNIEELLESQPPSPTANSPGSTFQ